jgi:hypothetical protein
MTREETLLVKEIIRKANTAILFLVEKNRCFPFPEEVQKYFSFTDKASDDLFVKMTVNKKYANSPTIEICLPLSGSWKIKRETFCDMIGNEKEFDNSLSEHLKKEEALQRETTYEKSSKDYKSLKKRMELLDLMTEQKKTNKNEL